MIQHPRRPSPWAGVRAVVRLLWSAVCELAAAASGVRPWRTIRRLGGLVGETYRDGKHGVLDGVEVIDEREDR